MPDFGMYTGYITGELAILGLEHAGKDPTRRGFIDGLRQLGTYDQAGLACQPVDISLANYGKPPPTICAHYVKVENGRFVPFPKNGKAVVGKLIRESTASGGTTPSS